MYKISNNPDEHLEQLLNFNTVLDAQFDEIEKQKETIRKRNLLIANLRLKIIRVQELECMDNKCPYKIQTEGL